VEDDLRPGQVLGPYELILPVGIGGMARVWAARVRGTGQVVALKMLLPALMENPSFHEMFFDEARIASGVRHPNVAQTYELESYDGILTIVMEWVDGGSLMRVFRPGPEQDENRQRVPLPFRHAARIIADACAGLHAAHEMRDANGRSLEVVHRDVSPHNVLITTSGEIKLTDFGVAKALNKSHVTIAGQIKGKLAYMSPEQLMGGGIDRRSDVFALGCVLYEITTGARPFQGDHDPQVMAAIMIGSYEPPQNIRRDYPPELAAIIARALDGDPERRFPTADHLRSALEQFLRTSGPPLTSQHIAALLDERIGPEIHARAAALGTVVPAPPRSAPQPNSGPGAMAVDRRGAPPPSNTGFVGLALAVLIGAGIGAAVLFVVRDTMRKAKTPLAPASASVSATTTAPASTSAAAPTLVAEASAPPAASEDITIDDDLDASAALDAADDGAAAIKRKARPAPKASASTDEAPPDLPPNPFE
jgi:eukaryotic-like serine/threonine-protein kinase